MKINSSLLMEDVWDRIEEEIRKQNRTKLSVAEQCGFNRRILQQKGKHRGFYLPYFVRLCSALNVSADYLLFGATEHLFVPGLWERINQEIYDQNRTKKDIAACCGFNRELITGYDDKVVNLSLPHLMLLCKELNVSADYLLFGKKKES